MTREDVANELRAYLVGELGVPIDLLDGNVPLLDGGLIDSLAVVSLVAFCEETLDCVVPADEITPDAFQSLQTLVDAVVGRWSHG